MSSSISYCIRHVEDWTNGNNFSIQHNLILSVPSVDWTHIQAETNNLSNVHEFFSFENKNTIDAYLRIYNVYSVSYRFLITVQSLTEYTQYSRSTVGCGCALDFNVVQYIGFFCVYTTCMHQFGCTREVHMSRFWHRHRDEIKGRMF